VDKIAFLDRDGTLNIDKNYIYKWTDFEWIPEAKDFIVDLKNAGYFIYVISNQGGIAKKMYNAKDVLRLFNLMNQDLFRSHAVKIDGIRFCPHHPDFSGPCACRKPEIFMFNNILKNHRLVNKEKSFMVGDHTGDYDAGIRLGIRSFLLQHDYGHSHPHDHIPKNAIIHSLKEIIL
jgi:D,D-heptose 1,7-bisphosphate phosphatase